MRVISGIAISGALLVASVGIARAADMATKARRRLLRSHRFLMSPTGPALTAE